MNHKKREGLRFLLPSAISLPTALLGVGLAIPAPAAFAIVTPDEIIVTARRTEEVLQNVPISMTVFNQDMLTERNVTSGADLATYTPSLSVNTRFGADQTTFAIRGFTQELRTTASVAVYFADVVAPRGGGSVTAGDGAGPGAFFDLQNVQVLKGPQGTLFGRNTTGGALQLVPQEPTDKLEGYLELSAGNYDMRRAQGVLNVPISDSVRARFGVDSLKRDGYIKNLSDIGPDAFSDVDYVASRASVMWDITDTLSNYTIFTHTKSSNNGNVQSLFACNPSASAYMLCQPALEAQGDGFYDATNGVSTTDPLSELKQWQVINTTNWEITDDFSIKNNLSFANLEQTTRAPIFGISLTLPFGTPVPHAFFPAGVKPGVPSNSQETFVEELQFSGAALDAALTWQAGLYYENSKPDGMSGALSPSLIACTWPLTGNPSDWNCPSALPGGSVNLSLGTIEYTNKAAYAQGTYDISDEFRVTLGVRYTVDKSEGEAQQKIYSFDPVTGAVDGVSCALREADANCRKKTTTKSEAPTWLIGFDYLPTPDAMIYAKYARGYRQGSVSIFAPAGIQEFDPEEVDAYELGAKTTFRGAISGTFNVALFYNKLKDQQIQGNYVPCSLANPADCYNPNGLTEFGSPTTAILNAGSSTIQGAEIETTLKLTDDLVFNMSYTYLETHLDSLSDAPTAEGYAESLSARVGGHLSFSPRHSVTAGLNYQLPLAADLGIVSVGGSYSFVSEQVSSDGTLGTLPLRRSVNLNAGWKAIAGSPFDVSLFVTNATDEEIPTYVPGLYDSFGMEFRVVGEPRMWGARVKYNFGL